MSPFRVALIGYGTVGQGVADLLRRHARRYARRCGRAVEVVAILVRDPSRGREIPPPPGLLLTSDADSFLAVPSDVLVEVAGGVEPAGSLVRRALESGRDVITANKALLAAQASDLFALAEKRRRRILFEAAVAGGVPVIRTVAGALASSRIEWFAGILNGTCNFILSAFARAAGAGGGERAYDEAVREAQRLGYAEADPALDVTGRDSLDKLAILASLAFDAPLVLESAAVPGHAASGLTRLAAGDLARAREAGGVVKLVAFGRRGEGVIEVFNGPMFVPRTSPLAWIAGASMGLVVRADAMPEVFVSGDGAGRYPTASAVVADILEAARLADCRDMPRLNPWPTGAAPMRVAPAALPITAGFPSLPE